MLIGVDARFYGPWGTGLGCYVSKLIENLERIDKRNEYRIFLRRGNFGLYRPKNKNFKKVLADVSWYSVAEQVLMPPLLLRERLDLLHVPHFNIPLFYPGKMVITIHDLIKSEFAGVASTTRSLAVYFFKHLSYEAILRVAVRRARGVLVPSNYVAEKIQRNLSVPKRKIVVTYEASSFNAPLTVQSSMGNEGRILARYGIRQPYLLYVGNAYPYKNLDRLLAALAQLNLDSPTSNLYLVNPCYRSVFYERLRQKARSLKIEDHLILPGFISDEDLASVYRHARAYVFPSLSEGFGIPGLDAMALGVPLIAARASSLPEVYGKAAFYFDPYDVADMAEKIRQVLNDESLANQLIKNGLRKVKEYSWSKMAEETLRVYNHLN